MLSGKLQQDVEGTLESLILWFRPQWLEGLIEATPELRILKTLLQESKYGLSYSNETAEKIYSLLNNHNSKKPHQQFMCVLEVLITLAEDPQTKKIASTPSSFIQVANDDVALERVESARGFIEDHYAKQIKISDLCQAIHLSESSTYRLFEKHFNESFSEHLKRFRTGKASELLVNTRYPIALIAEKTGFNNLSNFNRQFKTVKGMTPSEFRTKFKLMDRGLKG
ncbi:AraC family transcriptional regulator [Vibrio sp. SCSIO 43136]|uniref:helix-turn-helix domain-containing protein n=1 Tax=Vibrio sp. SCSIO 43136 TaxID=2819101 RepID=UPI00336568FE